MIYEGELFSDYVKRPELNASTLKHYIRSAKTGWYEENKPRKNKTCFGEGRLIHALVLEGEKAFTTMLEREFILDGFPVNPKTDKPYLPGSRSHDEWYATQDQTKAPLFPERLQELKQFCNHVREHEPSYNVLKRCKRREAVITWTCKYTGTECKAMIDACGRGIAVDLKTTALQMELGILEKEMHKRAYHMQFAFYADGLHANGIDPDEFYVIFAQNVAPFDVGCFEVCYTALEQGRTDYIKAIANYNKARQPGKARPGNFPHIQTIGIPYYAVEQDEDQGVNMEGM